MILQNPTQVTPSTIQNTYGAILNTTNKASSTTPTSAVSDYAVQPSASSPVLSAFFQTLSQIDQKSQNTSTSQAGSQMASIMPSTTDTSSTDTTNALQAFTYSLFQNLQITPSATSATLSSNSSGLGPLPAVTPGANTTYLNNLPTRLNTLSATLKSANPTAGANTLEGLRTAYQSLLNSMGSSGGSVNVNTTNSSSLASFLDQMSQNLKSQNVTSINTKGSLLDTKA